MGIFLTALMDGFVGVVAGVATAGLLYGAKGVLQKIVLPWYREKKYQGVLLDGEWFGMDEDAESSSEMSLSLKQSAHELKGTFHIRHASASNPYDLSFTVTGYLWEGYITLNLMPSSREVTSYAAGLLKVAGGGTSLVGQLAFRNVEQDAVGALHFFLMRGTRAHVLNNVLHPKEKKAAVTAEAA